MASCFWNIYLISQQVSFLAEKEARANWNKDLSFRRWATRHGGVYVKVDNRTKPSPYLSHLSQRDVTTTGGVKLTLMNPAFMMSQMTSEFDDDYGIKGSITGQVLLNPENAPDKWELKALKLFDEGVKELVEHSEIDGGLYLRLMKPMIMEEGCMKCHGHLGFNVGDIRGGISVSIPLEPYIDASNENRFFIVISHLFLWLVGAVTIFVFQKIMSNKVDLQYQAEIKLQSNEHEKQLIKDEMLVKLQKRDNELVIAKEAAELLAERTRLQYDKIKSINTDLSNEVVERKRVEEELKELNKTIEEKSRVAAIAEMSSGILHNIGNVLNSISTSATVVRRNFDDSSLQKLPLIVELINEHKDSLDDFLNNDEKGKQVLPFLSLLYDRLEHEKSLALDEIRSLLDDIDHVRSVISMQQNYAGGYGEKEAVDIMLLIENAIKTQQHELDENNIIIKKFYGELAVVSTYKHKLLQILINLISNAKHAMIDSESEDNVICITVTNDENTLSIEVSDTGVGISGDDLDRLFEYGFTKKKGGHGFGLHHSMNIAKELGGDISVASDGPGMGAKFTITIPFEFATSN